MKKLPSGRVAFNWNVPPEMRERFDLICKVLGLQKQRQVELMLEKWLEQKSSEVHDGPTTESMEFYEEESERIFLKYHGNEIKELKAKEPPVEKARIVPNPESGFGEQQGRRGQSHK